VNKNRLEADLNILERINISVDNIMNLLDPYQLAVIINN